MKPSVAVLGGGVAGMSAAHELIERGFRVHVYEKRADRIPGGKARSLPVPNSASEPGKGEKMSPTNGLMMGAMASLIA